MTNNYMKAGGVLISMILILLLIHSCEKREDVIEKDSEQLMIELKGSWNLTSMRQILLKTTDNGYSWDIDSDDTLSASGELNISSIDTRYYTGSIHIMVDTIDETHAINGKSYKNQVDEMFYINTDDHSDIQAFLLYSGMTSENMFHLEGRDQNQFVIWRSEYNYSRNRLMEKHFKFTKAR